ncbi:MAG: proline--tRNA ligase [Betaproteobacteria bacterium]|nr:proline--tRNA ligase [Betaproteobacteria bacterium]
MRSSRFFFTTLKEAPADAEIVSQKLMLRAGLIKRVAAGIYTWMPLGLRTLRKVEAIVREEMNRAGAVELLMPAVQPAELWQESGRWEQYGPELLRFQDRHRRDFVIGPTHEEAITDVVRRDVKSYRQLPVNLYQIQTKFRDEIRPRFGIMRGREFLMKDAYSFHTGMADLEREYHVMFNAYSRIFTRLGLKFRAVAADTGAIGGSGSHEFHVIAETGEDEIAYCPDSDYAANVELAEAVAPAIARPAAKAPMQKVATPDKTACKDVAESLSVPLSRIVKSIAVVSETAEGKTFALLLLRGDHELNEIKAGKATSLSPFRFASEEEVTEHLNCQPGYIGPVGTTVRVIADRAVAVMGDFACGANEAGFHLINVNFGRDCKEPEVADLRKVTTGDPSPDGKGLLTLCRGIEVGHIFQLGAKYSEALACRYLDENGKSQVMEMGCYGIGVSRIVGAAIEQNHDENGIIFPVAIAPFTVAIVPMGYHKNAAVRETADKLYNEIVRAGFDALLDDRNERPGFLFADMELIGIPHRLVVSERGLKNGEIEYKGRMDKGASFIPQDNILEFLNSLPCFA